jgi:hypothetical protein
VRISTRSGDFVKSPCDSIRTVTPAGLAAEIERGQRVRPEEEPRREAEEHRDEVAERGPAHPLEVQEHADRSHEPELMASVLANSDQKPGDAATRDAMRLAGWPFRAPGQSRR